MRAKIGLLSGGNVSIIARTVVLDRLQNLCGRAVTMAANEGSYIRWQSIAINQLGYTLNLFLTFSAASLGFTLTLVKNSEVTSTCLGTAFLILSIISLSLSLAFGIWCVLNRLSDFRKTAQNARDKEVMKEITPSPDSDIIQTLQKRRAEVKRLGEKTWILFHWQIGTFCAGVVSLVGTLVVAYHARFF